MHRPSSCRWDCRRAICETGDVTPFLTFFVLLFAGRGGRGTRLLGDRETASGPRALPHLPPSFPISSPVIKERDRKSSFRKPIDANPELGVTYLGERLK